MNWWQGALIFLGSIIAAGLLGLLLGYVILRLQNRTWPYSWPRRNPPPVFAQPPVPFVRAQPGPEKQVKSSAQIHEAFEDFVKKRQPAPVMAPPARLPKSDFLIEIETDLAIATAPWTGKLTPFQTGVLDANRSRLDYLTLDIKEQLTEAYTDMRLANNVVWLSMDVGRRSQELDDSYLKLCNRIAGRLRSVLPSLARSGI